MPHLQFGLQATLSINRKKILVSTRSRSTKLVVTLAVVAGIILAPTASAIADDSPVAPPPTTEAVTTTEAVDDTVVADEAVTTEDEAVTDTPATEETNPPSSTDESTETVTEPTDDSSAEVTTPPATTTETVQPACVSDYNLAYTIVKSGDHFISGTMVASAKDAKEGTPLCKPLFTSATTWAYEKANTQWPQLKVADNYLHITSIGSFTVNFTPVKCGQYDWYASDKDEASVTTPQHLNGPSNPWKEVFVSSYASGPTPHQNTSTYGCSGIPELPENTVEYGEWEDEELVCGAESVTTSRTVTTTTHERVFENGEYVIHSASSISTEYGTRPLTEEEIESCIPMDAVAHIEFGQAATCDAASTINPVIANATWKDPFETEPGTYTNVAIADEGHHFPGDAENPGGYKSLSFTYVIDAATGYQSADSQAPCYVAPQEQPKPEEPKEPVVVQAGLAATGGELPIGVTLGAIALLIGGGVLVARKSMSAKASK